MRLLVTGGANVNARCSLGRTPVHAALEGASHAALDILKQAGANFEAKDESGDTPLHYFSRSFSRRSAHQLHSSKERYSVGKFSVQDFLVYKPSLDTQNHEGSTPLHIAASLGSSKTANTLIMNGADIKVADELGRTALHLAAKYGDREIAIHLVKAGANLEAQTRAAQTPLMMAACNYQWGIVLLLASKGALVKPANDSQRDALATLC